MEKIEIVGLPSGEIIFLSKKQLDDLKKEQLILKVKKYKGIEINKFCYDDNKLIKIRMFLILKRKNKIE